MIATIEAERRVITAVKCQLLRVSHVCDDTLKRIEGFITELDRVKAAFERSKPEGYAALRQLSDSH